MDTQEQTRGDSIGVMRSLFQEREGGAVPTSPLQLELREIDRGLASECYKRWHYLGDTGFIATWNFGVVVGDGLWGCISIGSPNATELDGYFNRYTQNGWYEIKRLALSDCLPKNSESRVIGIALKLVRKKCAVRGIVTYADDSVGHTGIIYKATGFKYLGMTAPKKDFYVNGVIQQRGTTRGKKGEWRDRTRKHLYVKELSNQ